MKSSFETSRTYPVGAGEVRRAFEAAVHALPRWRAQGNSRGAGEVRRAFEAAVHALPRWRAQGNSRAEGATAVRRTRLGFEDDVSMSLDERRTGAHTNTHAAFRSVSRIGEWDLGQNRRNLRELLVAMDNELRGSSSRERA